MIVDKNEVFMVPSRNTKMLRDVDFNWPNDTKVEDENDPQMDRECPKRVITQPISLLCSGISYKRCGMWQQVEISQITPQTTI